MKIYLTPDRAIRANHLGAGTSKTISVTSIKAPCFPEKNRDPELTIWNTEKPRLTNVPTMSGFQ